MLRLRLSRRILGFLCLLAALLCLLYGATPSTAPPTPVGADQLAPPLPPSAPSTDWFPYVTPPGIATDIASNPSYAPGYDAPPGGGARPLDDAPPPPPHLRGDFVHPARGHRHDGK